MKTKKGILLIYRGKGLIGICDIQTRNNLTAISPANFEFSIQLPIFFGSLFKLRRGKLGNIISGQIHLLLLLVEITKLVLFSLNIKNVGMVKLYKKRINTRKDDQKKGHEKQTT
jgi:hypothetical protein